MKLDLPTYSTIRTAGGFLSTLVLNGQGKNRIGRQGAIICVFTHTSGGGGGGGLVLP